MNNKIVILIFTLLIILLNCNNEMFVKKDLKWYINNIQQESAKEGLKKYSDLQIFGEVKNYLLSTHSGSEKQDLLVNLYKTDFSLYKELVEFILKNEIILDAPEQLARLIVFFSLHQEDDLTFMTDLEPQDEYMKMAKAIILYKRNIYREKNKEIITLFFQNEEWPLLDTLIYLLAIYNIYDFNEYVLKIDVSKYNDIEYIGLADSIYMLKNKIKNTKRYH